MAEARAFARTTQRTTIQITTTKHIQQKGPRQREARRDPRQHPGRLAEAGGSGHEAMLIVVIIIIIVITVSVISDIS